MQPSKMTDTASNKLVPIDVVTASASSGWAPGIDLRVVADPQARFFFIGDGYGPTYGGHYFPIALDPCVNAIQAALRQPDSRDVRGALMAGKRVADEYFSKYGTCGNGKGEIINDQNKPVGLFHCGVGISLVSIVGDSLHAAQIGLSRIYLLRDGDLRFLLLDHSLPSQFELMYGTDSVEYRQVCESHRTAITRMLGLSSKVEIDYTIEPIQESDQILLCSSGVWNHSRGEEIVRALMEAPTDQVAAITEKSMLQSRMDAAVVRFRVGVEKAVSL